MLPPVHSVTLIPSVTSPVNSKCTPPNLEPIRAWIRMLFSISPTMSCIARVLIPDDEVWVLPGLRRGGRVVTLGPCTKYPLKPTCHAWDRSTR